jgi:hypothetical protein
MRQSSESCGHQGLRMAGSMDQIDVSGFLLGKPVHFSWSWTVVLFPGDRQVKGA